VAYVLEDSVYYPLEDFFSYVVVACNLTFCASLFRRIKVNSHLSSKLFQMQKNKVSSDC
jgi:hypothetical protein